MAVVYDSILSNCVRPHSGCVSPPHKVVVCVQGEGGGTLVIMGPRKVFSTIDLTHTVVLRAHRVVVCGVGKGGAK